MPSLPKGEGSRHALTSPRPRRTIAPLISASLPDYVGPDNTTYAPGMFVQATASLPPLGITGAQMSVRVASAVGTKLQTVTFNFSSSNLSPVPFVTLTGVTVTVDTVQRSVVGAWNPSRPKRAGPQQPRPLAREQNQALGCG
jgi:hypothetical protein